MTHRQKMAAFFGVLLALLLAALDQTVVSTALPRIASDLHGFSELSWIVTAYLLTSTATVPLYGKLSDLYGRRNLFVVAIVIFLLGSALCGVAQSMTQLTIFRAVQGLGAGGLFPLTMTAIGDLTSDLSTKRGHITGTEARGAGIVAITGQVPVSELTEYPSRLRSMTGGHGSYSIEYSHYAQVPGVTQQHLAAKYAASRSNAQVDD